jgi:hypothetical protein
MPLPTDVLVRITIPVKDPTDDAASLGFAFTQGLGAPAFGDLAAAVQAFINALSGTQTLPLAQYLGPQVDRGANRATWSIYDLDGHLNGSPHGSPVSSGNWTVGAAGGGGALPSGCAACISWRADYGADVEFGAPTGVETGRLRPRARDRNRVFLGPISQLAVNTDGATGRCKFSPTFIADCMQAIRGLLTVGPGPNWDLQAWSRKNASTKSVFEFSMDDRPDYQRRRSDPSSARTVLLASA